MSILGTLKRRLTGIQHLDPNKVDTEALQAQSDNYWRNATSDKTPDSPGAGFWARFRR